MTIRLRLTLWYTALLGITLILFSVAVYSALSTNLWAQVRQDAARQAREVARAITFEVLIVRTNPRRFEVPNLDFFAGSSGVQFIDLDGMVQLRTENFGEHTIPKAVGAIEAVKAGNDHDVIASTDGIELLIYSTPVIVNKRIVGAIQVVRPVTDVKNVLNQISRYLILGTGLSLMLAAIVGAFLARRALTPIDTITVTAGGINRTQDLSKRLTIEEDHSEVGQLAATFNAMLDQIQSLFETQQRLIADVSHELRTPLTTVQGNIHLLQRITATQDPSFADVRDEFSQVLIEVDDEADRMARMIGDLLLLAQADSGAAQLQSALVEMDTLVLDVYRQALRIAERAKGPDQLQILLGDEDQALVHGDREHLRQLLLNLVENAVKYTPAGGTVKIGLTNTDEWVKVAVEDSGIGIRAADQASIFDRFYRTDKARSRELGGSGLGLSIARWIAEAHDGKITVESEFQKGSVFTLWLPRSVHDRRETNHPPADTSRY